MLQCSEARKSQIYAVRRAPMLRCCKQGNREAKHGWTTCAHNFGVFPWKFAFHVFIRVFVKCLRDKWRRGSVQCTIITVMPREDVSASSPPSQHQDKNQQSPSRLWSGMAQKTKTSLYWGLSSIPSLVKFMGTLNDHFLQTTKQARASRR